MTPRPYVVRAGRDGLLYVAEPEDDVLVIYLPAGLDEVTRRRYIRQALDDHDWYYQRQPFLVPIVSAGSRMKETVHRHPLGAGVAAGVITTGIAAAAVLSIAGHRHVRPEAAPAVPGSAPSSSGPRPSLSPRPAKSPQPARSPRPARSPQPELTVTTPPPGQPRPTRQPVKTVISSPPESPPVTSLPVERPSSPPPVTSPPACLLHVKVGHVADVRVLCERTAKP